VEVLAKETPPVDNAASRFGNPAFKTFYDKVQQARDNDNDDRPHPPAVSADYECLLYHKAAPQLHESLPVQLPAEAVTEVSGYFCESWGNRTRIDYGSGMELNFLCWLCVIFSLPTFTALVPFHLMHGGPCRICLEQLGVVRESDHVALVTKVFWRLDAFSANVSLQTLAFGR
jgi:serine/threonine-protein phosphatase 2A activator